MRWIKFSLSLLITLILIAVLNWPFGKVTFAPGAFLNPFGGFWQNAEPAGWQPPATLSLEGLQSEGEVVYDERGIPHIFADNLSDLAAIQGYVTARDRLWQMEFQTHAASGRLTEIIGRGPDDVVLNMDRSMRRLGMVWAAEHALEEINRDTETRNLIDAYTQGVNAYINNLKPLDYPLEYKLLHYRPEPWTPLKCALLIKYMAYDLSGKPDDLEHTNARKLWGKEIFDLLYPERPYAESPIITEGTRFLFQDVLSPPAPQDYEPDSLYMLTSATGNPNLNIGSNNWAVSGSKTLSGKPLLANDPHLGLNLPAIWYEVQLKGDGFNVYGVSLPGAPGVIIGFNDSIAWGVTNAGRDVLDYYKVTFQDESKELYNYQGTWRPATTRIETHLVKGDDAFLDTVYYTDYGPVMYDENFGDKPVNLAVRWMAHQPSNEVRGFLELDRSKNYEDYRNAIQHHICPAQNFVFASKAGDVAMTQQGRFVAKWPGQGEFVLDAADSTHDWQGYIPFEQNPTERNPVRGFVSSANQHPADLFYPYYYNGRFQVYRNRRLNQLLTEKDSMTTADMQAIQQDNYGLYAAELLPVLLADLDSGQLSARELRAYRLLKGWDYYFDWDKVAPTVFQQWLNGLKAAIWNDEFGDTELALDKPALSTTIRLLRDSAEFRFFDDRHTPVRENRKVLVNSTFKQAIETLTILHENPEDWTWGEFKGTQVRHLTKVLKPFNRTALTSGYSDILNATSKTHGPSWRMVVSLTEPVEAYGIYPGGPSGNPGSPRYDSFLQDWAEGKYYRLWFMQSAEDAGGKVGSRVKVERE